MFVISRGEVWCPSHSAIKVGTWVLLELGEERYDIDHVTLSYVNRSRNTWAAYTPCDLSDSLPSMFSIHIIGTTLLLT